MGMIDRCTNKKGFNWPNYGGRGISVCKKWLVYKNFLFDMGVRPPGTSLDRIDNDGNYEPGNCRWATATQQVRNRRIVKLHEFQGRRQGLAAWAEEFGLPRGMLVARMQRGWTIEEALASEPEYKYVRGPRSKA
jgi:hypothetical protein